MKKIGMSFYYAYRGIIYALMTQRNLQIHFAAVVLVTFTSYYFQISDIEKLIIFLFFALVIGLELINSAIETLADKLHPEQDEKIGRVKDMSAGAVLIAAIFAVISSVYIFLPKFFF